MGEAGRNVQKLTNDVMKIAKITGLDPCGPGFYPLNPYIIALNRNDGDKLLQLNYLNLVNFFSRLRSNNSHRLLKFWHPCVNWPC